MTTILSERLGEALDMARPHYSREEFARRGDELFERHIRSQIPPGSDDKFVLIDIDSGAYEVDADERAASGRLRARHPDAQIWTRRVGSPYARRFGTRTASATA